MQHPLSTLITSIISILCLVLLASCGNEPIRKGHQFEIAEQLMESGDFTSAKMLLDSVIFGHNSAYIDTTVAMWYSRRGTCFYNLGQFDSALTDFRTVYNADSSYYPGNHSRILQDRSNIAALLMVSGRLWEARLACDTVVRLLEGRSAWSPQDSADYLTYLDNLATSELLLGNFPEAARLFETVLLRERSHVPVDSSALATTLNNYADLLNRWNHKDQAERAHREALMLRLNCRSIPPIDVAGSYSNLADLLVDLNRPDSAQSIARQAVAYCSENVGANSSYTANCLLTLARAQVALRNFAAAQNTLEQALDIYLQDAEANQLQLATTYYQLADNLQSLGHFSLALSHLDSGIVIRRQVLGERHSDYAECLLLKGSILLNLGQRAEASENYRVALEIKRKHFIDNSFMLSESGMFAFSEQSKSALDKFIVSRFDSLSHKFDHPESLALEIVRTRGLVLDQLAARRKWAVSRLEQFNPEVWHTLVNARAALAFCYVDQSMDGTTRTQRIDSLSSSVNNLERQAFSSGTNRPVTSGFSGAMGDITGRIDSVSVVIEYFAFGTSSVDEGSQRLGAIVLRRDRAVAVIDLTELSTAQNIAMSLTNLGGNISGSAKSRRDAVSKYQQLSHRMYELVWAPLLPYLQGTSNWSIVPDAGLQQISFASLRNAGGDALVSAGVISYLTSARDIVSPVSAPAKGQLLVSLGDPAFDDLPAELSPDTSNSYPAEQTGQGQERFRGSSNRLSQLASWEQLPYSRKEVEAVAHSWSGRSNATLKLGLGAEASEAFFRANAPKASLLHLATHAFSSAPGEQIVASFGRYDHQYFSGGVVLAGANRLDLRRPEYSDNDGIVFAEDCLDLDLSGVNLVIVSACASGSGQNIDWEGVSGLRRALLLAGARNLLVTLWPVEDEQSSRIVERLANCDLTHGVSSKLREIQLEMSGTDDPFSWAGYLIIGRHQ